MNAILYVRGIKYEITALPSGDLRITKEFYHSYYGSKKLLVRRELHPDTEEYRKVKLKVVPAFRQGELVKLTVDSLEDSDG